MAPTQSVLIAICINLIININLIPSCVIRTSEPPLVQCVSHFLTDFQFQQLADNLLLGKPVIVYNNFPQCMAWVINF